MEFAVTERAVFKRCRRKWDYQSRNRKNLAPIISKQALSLGTLVHQALESWLFNPSENLPKLFMQHAGKAMLKAAKQYQKNTGMKMNPTEMQPLEEAAILGVAMMQNYQDYYKVPLAAKYEILMPEQSITIDIPGSEHKLKLRLDGIFRNEHGQIYVLEHKTYSFRPNPKTLAGDDQLTAYIWSANQLGLGEVVGVAYDGMWKRNEPPKGKKLAELFHREKLYRSPAELEEFEVMLAVEAEEMAYVCKSAETNPFLLYKNRRWEGCNDCDFENLCTTTSRGEDVDYVLKTFFVESPDDDDDEGN